MSNKRLLVIAFGNPLCRDDGVGIAAIEELRRRGMERPGVDLMDGGARGIDLLSLLEEYDLALVLDAALAREEPVGEIVEVDLGDARFLLRPRLSLHNLDLGTAFELARALDMKLPRVELVLMRVRDVGPGEGLTEAARSALPAMVEAAARKINGFANRMSRARAAEAGEEG
ncbi:MAG: hydrogenase maturation protease [Candidatus Eisenbacteria bacterium]